MFLIQLNTENFTGSHLDFNQSNHHGEKKNISNKTSNLGGQVNSRKSGKTPATRSRLPSLLSDLIGLECDACHSAVSFTLDSKNDKIDTIEFKFFFFEFHLKIAPLMQRGLTFTHATALPTVCVHPRYSVPILALF